MTGFTSDFDDFRASRSRFFDNLAAESLLYNIERNARPTREEPMEPILIEADLTILVADRRLVLGHSTPVERDLAETLGAAFGLPAGPGGVSHVGPVRITVERLASSTARPRRDGGR